MLAFEELHSWEDLLKSSDKIAYMSQFDKIKLKDPYNIFNRGEFLLNMNDFKVFASMCIVF